MVSARRFRPRPQGVGGQGQSAVEIDGGQGQKIARPAPERLGQWEQMKMRWAGKGGRRSWLGEGVGRPSWDEATSMLSWSSSLSFLFFGLLSSVMMPSMSEVGLVGGASAGVE